MAINLQQTLRDPLYRNWVTAGLSLKVTRDGLQCYVDGEVQNFQQKVMAAGTVCNTCTTQNVLPCRTRGFCPPRGGCNYHKPGNPTKGRKPCSTGICHNIRLSIIKSHRFGGPSWRNTDAQHWCSNSWELAKCYMPADGYNTVTSATETDFTGLISIIINHTEFQNTVTENLSSPNNVFCQARTRRNEILHTPTFQITDAVLHDHIDTMIQLLSDAKQLAADTHAQDAIAKLKQIKTGSLAVTAQDEAKMREEALQAIREETQEAKDDIQQEGSNQTKIIECKRQEVTQDMQEKGREIEKYIEKKKNETIQDMHTQGKEQEGSIREKKTEAIKDMQSREKEAIVNIQKMCKEQETIIEETKIHVIVDIHSKGSKQKEDIIKEIQAEGSKQVEHIVGKKQETIKEIQAERSKQVEHIVGKKHETIKEIQAEGSKQVEHIVGKKHETIKEIQAERSKQSELIDGKKQETIKEIQAERSKQTEHIDGKKQETITEIQAEKEASVQVIKEQTEYCEERGKDITEAIQTQGSEQSEHLQHIYRQAKYVDNVKPKAYINEKKDIQRDLFKLYEDHFSKMPINALFPEEADAEVADLYVKPRMCQESLQYVCSDNPQQQQSKEKVKSYHDIFYKKSQPCKNIYITGDAGFGKSALCQRMITTWCRAHTKRKMADPSVDNEQMSLFHRLICKCCKAEPRLPSLSQDEKAMLEFDFLFYISLRHARADIDIQQMITNQLLPNHSHILSTILTKEFEKCLIILDGLDEWSPPKHHQTSPFVNSGLPTRTTTNKCTILTTTRPWKLEVLRLRPTEIDQKLTMKSLDGESKDELIRSIVNILNSKYGYNRRPNSFREVLWDKKLESLTTVPVILQQLACLWYDNKPLGESQCAIYSGMTNLLFELAEERLKEHRGLVKMKQEWKKSKLQLPECFKGKLKCKEFRPLLHSLGKLSFETLFSVDQESSLVFESSVVEMYGLSQTEIDICLKVGVLSQSIIIKECTSRTKSLSFLHKTFQEYLAAMYISMSTNQHEVTEHIFRICTSVNKVLEMSKVFLFVYGMCPEIAQELSKHVNNATKLEEKTRSLNKKLESVEKENEQLKDLIAQKSNLSDLKKRVENSERRSKDAEQKANYNEQYSRKNNIKFMNVLEIPSETEESLTNKICEMVATTGVTINPSKIVAIHRIPGKPGHPKPVLLKLMNNNEKSKIMRHRREFKQVGTRLVDDVTKSNAQLISSLLDDDAIESAWYFNGGVFGKTKMGIRHKFDIHDDIAHVIRKN